MASYPDEDDKYVKCKELQLHLGIGRTTNGWMLHPGVASSYTFGLKKKENKATISRGPYGRVFLNDSDAEMLHIGGGAGMAPMRSHLYELFKTLKTA